MLNQLRTMQSLELTMVNEMLREVYVTDILPKKGKKNVDELIEARLR